MIKFNWGTGIFLAVTLFVIGTLSVVSYVISLEFYLVSNNHYEQGVEYQSTIDSKNRAKNLNQPVVVLFDESSTAINLFFPGDILEEPLEGSIIFYRPNNPELDRKFELNLDADGRQSISVGNFEKGRWRLSVEWTQQSLTYLEEKNIFI